MRISIIGLGYVGLPLAMAFGEKYRVLGYDIDPKRIAELRVGNDHTLEVKEEALLALIDHYQQNDEAAGIFFTDDVSELKDCNTYIITVPTPVDSNHAPDLALLKMATKTVAGILKKGDIVIYESTVFPGCTEEIAVPILEKLSGLMFNMDFFCGYSPERINPGDKKRTIGDIRKITSGSTQATRERVDALYASIIKAGTYSAPSIKIAEAAKVIENTQRDINIAFVNELARIFHLLDIDTREVLKAAATKWNFLPFEPGLVGGHCIGIDPYYLADKARAVGYDPAIIVSARKMNDSMGGYVAQRVIDLMAQKAVFHPGAEVLIMGITFKENFADVRNSKVVDIVQALDAYHLSLTICDPVANPGEVTKAYGLQSSTTIDTTKKYAAIIIAVGHAAFLNLDYDSMLIENGVLFDVKGVLEMDRVDGRL
ncbi:MAG: nucleotide sugar dehydrogenase [Sediminibacterium sp.]|nr:nucleotide sugar dehydrogenase [Sediminibacterium sp.]